MNNTVAETITFRLAKSDEVMRDAQTLIAAKSWNGAMNRLYYSAFHAVSALMLARSIRIKAHAGAKAMFELHFVKPGIVDVKWSKFYTRLFENRNDSDYEDFIVFTADDILPPVPETEQFIALLKRLIQTE